jgi:nucleoside-diphosphate-sugar epimerase
MKNVLITGAAGFIGSHLCDSFVNNNHNVVGMDNLITGQEKNIEHLYSKENFEFIEHDVSLPFDFDQKFDLILHFACPASPVDYLKYPLETMKVNSNGTFELLELAKSQKARYLFASTSEVYGDAEVHPQSETYWGNVNSVGARSVYNEAKRFSETVSMSYFREFAVDIRIIRIFNTYGPRMQSNDGRVVPAFISQALKGEDITVYGQGTQTRSFCYIDDLITGIYKISTTPDLNGTVINLGNPEEYKIIDFAELIIEKIDTKSKIIYKPLPEDDPKQRCPNISKANQLIGWYPKISLKEGLEKTIKFFVND